MPDGSDLPTEVQGIRDALGEEGEPYQLAASVLRWCIASIQSRSVIAVDDDTMTAMSELADVFQKVTDEDELLEQLDIVASAIVITEE